MPAPNNVFKQSIKGDDVLYGCWLSSSEAHLAEIATTANFDWLVIDGEHGPNDVQRIISQLRVIDPSNSSAVVRPPIGEAAIIKQYLDAGVQTLLVPMVESGAQAAELVRATQYPPTGIRGVGSYGARASEFGGIADYLTTADDEICLICQVENRKGLENLEDIIATDGVDAVFIGPSDLAADMGHIGKPGTPEVTAAVIDAIKRIRAGGKAAGILTTDETLLKASQEAGANFIAVGIDVAILASGLRSLSAKYKG